VALILKALPARRRRSQVGLFDIPQPLDSL
jgi:hypothetical protein